MKVECSADRFCNKVIDKFVKKKQRSLFIGGKKTNYLIALHFGNTLYNYLRTLVKKTISHRKRMWQVWSESDVVIWLLLSELGLVKVPVLPLQFLECLMLTLQNLQHIGFSSHFNPFKYNVLFFFIFIQVENASIRNFDKPFGFNNSKKSELSHCFKSLVNRNHSFIQNV